MGCDERSALMAMKRQDFVTEQTFYKCEWNKECVYPARLKDGWTEGKWVCVECYKHAIDHTRADREAA